MAKSPLGKAPLRSRIYNGPTPLPPAWVHPPGEPIDASFPARLAHGQDIRSGRDVEPRLRWCGERNAKTLEAQASWASESETTAHGWGG
jgi:hypothetical protein